MILSMTGFGEARAIEGGVSYRVEIRCVNNRYFKASIKLPDSFQRYEAEVDRLLRSRLLRGSITFSLRLVDQSPAAAARINTIVLEEYVRQLMDVGKLYNQSRIDLSRLLDAPGILQEPDIDENKLSERFEFVKGLTNRAMDGVVSMRKAEGEALLRDLQVRCADLRNGLSQIKSRTPSVVGEYQKRLNSRVLQLLDGLQGVNVEMHQDALAREVAIFAERCDVNEEISRLASHLDQFEALCGSQEESGRKLDFLAQELLREANTIGSKSNDAEIARHVVDMKAAIDRIKEQVQNVE